VFSKEVKGSVRLFESSYSSVCTEFVISDSLLNDKMHPTVPPTGLSVQRQLYLFSSIRPYIADTSKDLLCPKPAEPQYAVFKEPSAPPAPDKATYTLPSLVRSSPKCGFCRQIGHRNSIVRENSLAQSVE